MTKLKTNKKKKLVIVESPIKAKTISRFLSSDYIVESCMGHIRDLPSSAKEISKEKKKNWSRFGVDIENNFEPFYLIPPSKKKIVENLKKQIKNAEELILATDEDREGESISWHLQKILKPEIPVKRMVFHEITKVAINKALKNFREVDLHLVQAQEARRILDRLVGYSLSPVLWKKVTPGLSAGRVQSVAVSLVSDRELERLNFKKSQYWDLTADHKTANSEIFTSRLVSYKDKKLIRSSDFDSATGEIKTKDKLFLDEKGALKIKESLERKKTEFIVTSLEKKQVTRRPPPPFITSTLQQECNRKLGFSSKQTMRLAQQLYEKGFITYMRTDSVFLSGQAIKATVACISKLYGKAHVPSTPRIYRQKSKGAQEAHEAIRPSGDQFVEPVKTGLTDSMLSLYEIIWKRTLASQMKDCIQNQMRVEITADSALFQISGVSIHYPGFYLVYPEKTQELELPILKKGDKLKLVNIKPVQHETKPLARYTEASLIQKLEKEGVGRPSTYASIITTIQDRGYVEKKQNALIPTFTALVVSRFLDSRFPDYVDTQFTSEMEKDLDDIAQGKKQHIKYLKSVYFGSKGLKKLIETEEKKMQDTAFRKIKLKGFEEYSFNVGPFGSYVSKGQGKKEVSVTLPKDLYPGEITKEKIESLIKSKVTGGHLLGLDPKTGEKVFMLSGPYGLYVQLGENEKVESGAKPTGKKKDKMEKLKTKKNRKKNKKASLAPFFTEDTITLKSALKLLELPKVVGKHPETGKEIKKAIGRFGPYIVHDGDFRSVSKDVFFDVDMKYALKRLSEAKKQKTKTVLKEFKEEKTGESIQLLKGFYGPYLRYKGANYALPKQQIPEKMDIKTALNIISSRSAVKKKGKKKIKTERKKFQKTKRKKTK